MAYDEGAAEILRGTLADVAGITERKMFGGLAFLLDGNMVCGIHPRGAMFRVGKAREAKALALEDVRRMAFTGRPMGGFVELGAQGFADDALRDQVMEMALAFARSLPPK